MKMLDNIITNIHLGTSYGWNKYELPKGTVYFKGYLNSHPDIEAAAKHTANTLIKLETEEALKLFELDGHFACIVQTAQATIAAVDRVRSIPLLWAALPDGHFIVGDHAAPFMEHLNLGKGDIDTDAAQDLAISGYVIGRGTIYKEVKTLLAGEVAVFRNANASPKICNYANYRPWLAKIDGGDEKHWRDELREITLGTLRKVVYRAQGRQLLIPLSAGLDSRLIVSGLKYLGYENVQCFSYGRPGNHEATAASQIAEKLQFPWHFLPTSTSEVRHSRASDKFSRYISLADNLAATPIEQDVFTIMHLHKQPWVDRDGIIVNGQSGDFISGKHIPNSLSGSFLQGRQKNIAAIMAAMVNKHFDLWKDLGTEENLKRIQNRILRQFEEFDAPIDDPAQAFALYEFSEFQNRQAKYVLGNQRSYEVFGWDWHLPLWDCDYLEFWQKVPLKMKFDQRLYHDMLVEADWGGVWKSLLPAPQWTTPAAIRPIRHAVHLLCLPFDVSVWKAIDRRFFNYITDPLRKYSAVGYWQVALGPEHRNSISWLTKLYMERHGIGRDGKLI